EGAWANTATWRTETGSEAVQVGRADKSPESPHPSRAWGVHPAGVRRRRSNLPREACIMSRTDVRRGGTEGAVRPPDRGAGVSRGQSRPKSSVRSSGTLARKGRNGQGSHDRERAAEGPNDGEGESDSGLRGDMRLKIQ